MLASHKPTVKSFIMELLRIAVFSCCVAFFGGMGIMSALPADTLAATNTEAAQTQVVYYQELKNLGGGNYLCVVWIPYGGRATIIKLTAIEKAKLQRGIYTG